MAEKKVELRSGGKSVWGTELSVLRSLERPSEFVLADGSVLTAKVTVKSIVKVDGKFDAAGKPIFASNVKLNLRLSPASDGQPGRSQGNILATIHDWESQ